MCTRFGCNPQIIFVTFFAELTKSFLARLLPKHIDTGNLVNATPPTNPDRYGTLQVFSPLLAV